MRAGLIMLGGECFATREALEDRCRSILYALPAGDSLGAGSLAFMRTLLDRHPRAAEKIGAGVAAIATATEHRGTRHFVVVRTDGSREDFSFKSCVNGAPSAQRQFLSACRTAVVPQIQEFKRRAFSNGPVCCPLSGESLTVESCHIDHWEPRFVKIALDFLAHRNAEYPPISGTGTVTAFARAEDAVEFAEFHRTRAVLRAVSPLENLRRKRQGTA